MKEKPPLAQANEARAQCSCGHSRNHHMVSPEPEYTAWATFWVTMMGVSATPIFIQFRCRVCQEIFDSTDTPADLTKFI